MTPPTELTIAEQIGRQVRAALAEQRLSQVDLSPILGLTKSSVNRRLLGLYCFAGDELVLIGEHLGVDPARFLKPLTLPSGRHAAASPPAEPRTPTAAGSAA